MDVFLTGGHGFIGSRVVHQLAAKGHTIRCLVRASSKTHRIDDVPFKRFVGDVRDAASLVDGMRGADACIHLASVSNWTEMQSDALEATIIDGTRNILEAAKQAGLKRLVYVSSLLAVNGSKEPRTFDEASPFELEGSGLRYSIAKKKAEDLCLEYVKHGLDVVIVNPGEVYGAQDDAFVTAGNLRDILGSWPALACHGGTPVVHVDDVAEGTILALEKGRTGERYLLAGDNLTVEQLVRLTLEIGGKKAPVLVLPNSLIKLAFRAMTKLGIPTPNAPEVIDYATLYWFVDSSKAKRELGFNPRPARETIAPAIAWLYEAGHVKGKTEKNVPAAATR
jgi:dihydroflavonol-4-reductase